MRLDVASYSACQSSLKVHESDLASQASETRLLNRNEWLSPGTVLGLMVSKRAR